MIASFLEMHILIVGVNDQISTAFFHRLPVLKQLLYLLLFFFILYLLVDKKQVEVNSFILKDLSFDHCFGFFFLHSIDFITQFYY